MGLQQKLTKDTKGRYIAWAGVAFNLEWAGVACYLGRSGVAFYLGKTGVAAYIARAGVASYLGRAGGPTGVNEGGALVGFLVLQSPLQLVLWNFFSWIMYSVYCNVVSMLNM